MKNKIAFVVMILLFSACLNSTKIKEIEPLAKTVQYPKTDKEGYKFGFSYKTDSNFY